MKMQHRSHSFQVKSVEKNGTFSGYGSVFENVDSYKEVIAKGAFADTLKDWDAKGKLPKMLWQHDSREPIGVWTEMSEDDYGLKLKGRILVDAGPTEKRAYEHLKAGGVDGLSIGFNIAPGGVKWDSAREVSVITAVKLWEVSVVTFPANEQALVDEVRAAISSSPKELERVLRDVGLSRTQAKAVVADGFKALASLRDADDDSAQQQKQHLESVAAQIAALTRRFSENA